MASIDSLTSLIDSCSELRDRLNELREELTDSQFDKVSEGPLGEILCAAMDVEYELEKCEE